jgi:uncharacterized protein
MPPPAEADPQTLGDPNAQRQPAPVEGAITHSELVSADPDATRDWCAQVIGWHFMPSFPTPDGEYHMFAYSDQGGGGIRRVSEGESPGSVPYVNVADVQAAYDRALDAGAREMLPPTKVMEGVAIAVVRAPGGVAIGFSGPETVA